MEKIINPDYDVKFDLIRFHCRLIPCWVFGKKIYKIMFASLTQFSYGEWIFYDSKGNPKYYFISNGNYSIINSNTISSYVENNNLNYSDFLLELLHRNGYVDAIKYPRGINIRFEKKSYLADIELIRIVDYLKM